MVVVDTSIFIEFFRCNEPYFSKLKYLVEHRQVYALECVFAELLQGAKNKREIEIIDSYYKNLPQLSIEDGWLRTGRFSAMNNLTSKGIGLIDCYIIFAARIHESQVWSLDKKLNSALKKSELFVS
ncbi:MAG: hypothetical protein LDLANPLL_01395 [Turneriella sp.]|nr:hypothetical protein [Turneriella sp.]